jgi:hypothetical protein
MNSPEDSIRTELEATWNDARVDERVRRDDSGRAAFEDRAVRYVLRRVGQEGAITYIAREVRDSTGEENPQLTFAQVNHFLYGFPVRLGVARLYHLHELSLADLFRKPTKTQIYRAFHEWAEEDQADDERHLGLIFRMPGFPGNGNRAVLHTYSGYQDFAWARFTFSVEETDNTIAAKHHVFYTLEPLDQLLTTIARVYRPRNDYS